MESKVIVITGASDGIGAVLARRLGAQGHALVLAARREVELNGVAAGAGDHVLTVPTDVTRRAEVETLRDRALERFGHVDVWVNNAGRGIGIRVMDLTDENLDEMFEVNLRSALYGMHAIVPHFQTRGRGHLINVSSVLSRVPSATFRSAYSAAKAALNSLTANLRMDLHAGYPNIHVSLVMPGPVSTGFAANALGGTPASGSGTRLSIAQTADEVAEVMVELIEHPVPELYTNPVSAGMVARYYQDVAAFEQDVFFHRP